MHHIAQGGWKMSRNQELNPLHVDNATSFVESVSYHVVPGDTLIFDFIFFLHPVRLLPAGRAGGRAEPAGRLSGPARECLWAG